MSLVNINNSDDPFYRYKMPKVIIELRGSGNGCFTYLTNLDKIGLVLGHPSFLLLKFISFNLGCNSNSTEFYLQGHFKEDVIQNLIFDYCYYFVICPKCGVPELILDKKGKKKNVSIWGNCMACGFEKHLIGKNKIITKMLDLISKELDKKTFIQDKGVVEKEQLDFDEENFIL